MQSPPTRASKIDALTGIRILAALVVFVQHAVADVDSKGRIIHGSLRGWFLNAGLGVTLFFTLSGFVLTWTWTDRVTPLTFRSAWTFAVARFARIYPMYLLGLLAIVVFQYLHNAHSYPHIWLNVFALQTWSAQTGIAYAYNGPGWSIGVELFLYACFPLLAFAIRRVRVKGAVVLAVAAALVPIIVLLAFRQAGLLHNSPAVSDRWLYRSPVIRLGDFTVGMALATIVRYSTVTRRWIAIAAQAIGVIGLVVAMRTPITNFTIAYAKDDALWVVPAGILLLGLAYGHTTLLSKALSTKPMILLGETSYAFYLVHVPLLLMIGLPSMSNMTPRHWVVSTVLWFALTVAVAIGCHTAVERPLQRWLRRLLDPSSWRRRRRQDVSDTEEYVGQRRGGPLDEPALEGVGA